jgi:ABC-type uncharacterized transport system ATPase subunit
VHPGRSARNHLLFLAQTQGIPASRVEEVLALVGLQEVADKRVGGFSLGMSQRLGVAVAMLGNPEILLLDEPVNGLDPEGVLWIRNLMKSLSGAENGAGLLTVTGLEAPRIGELAASASIVLYELTPLASLEGAFMELTSGSVEFGAPDPEPVKTGEGRAR